MAAGWNLKLIGSRFETFRFNWNAIEYRLSFDWIRLKSSEFEGPVERSSSGWRQENWWRQQQQQQQQLDQIAAAATTMTTTAARKCCWGSLLNKRFPETDFKRRWDSNSVVGIQPQLNRPW